MHLNRYWFLNDTVKTDDFPFCALETKPVAMIQDLAGVQRIYYKYEE